MRNGIVVSQSVAPGEVVSELTAVVLVVNKLENKENDEPNNNNNNSGNESDKISIPINLSNKGERETFEVKVVLQGTGIGTRVEYEGTHSRSDGTINIDISNIKDAMLKVYIDGKLDSEQLM